MEPVEKNQKGTTAYLLHLTDGINKMTFIFTNNAMLLKCARTCYQILDIWETLATQV